MHSRTYRALPGTDVTEDNPGLDAICDTVNGEGHFPGGPHTLAPMERDYFYPALADRVDPRTSARASANDA